ncbi:MULTISPECIES: heat-inducible transcriptional repressor HrcA [Acetobacter]|uniref:Heat-inducible transcription repressor HrcA n=6 Tax=Acetobacter TaxID=434 RepID=C7JAU5_ACEP3|nr:MULTISPECIES: heat-inducible transcriptional repressor HrcA [Acetobacter]BAU37143.1 transcriptional repressor heat-inducible HrcA [Acetobacter pasteurianus NBRC 101655]MCP1203254.1 heat-inducible transcriptional repressor HrcA [Acetobacter oryzoeni]QHM91422.2 heat-inducible transcriptional repressor HrcA [Acetobacter pasteurianus]BAH98221.1 transcriptional repressor heat-inducible HrcA [Acetobacter pasteurianus IFO 3283-01]BAI01272.1 transcriptional repressor heat-inducible HrcA [Acetobacte
MDMRRSPCVMKRGLLPVKAALPPGLNARSAAILREVVEEYVASGEPVGSRTVSHRLGLPLSPATIRNIMASLTEAGLLFSPHTSAGRLPTEKGLRLFVDGLLQFGALSEEDQRVIGQSLEAKGRSLQDTLTEASSLLAGMSDAAGLVVAPKGDGGIKHIEFVALGSNRALVILVGADGHVENRVIETPPGMPPSALVEAANYLNARAMGASLPDLRTRVSSEMTEDRSILNGLTAEVVESGLAIWDGGGDGLGGTLIVRGQSRLLADVDGQDRLLAIQTLFDRLEAQETMLRLLELVENSEGVRIFIGAESGLFGATGMSVVMAPARNEANRIVGAIGVIGPTRINYGRIVPVVDYTARLLGDMLG